MTDDDEPPGFPWPMAIPAVQWILTGVACLGFAIYFTSEKLLVVIPRWDSDYMPLCVALIWFAYLFIKAGSGIILGCPQFVALANGHTLLASIFLMILMGFNMIARQNSFALLVFCHGFAMFAGCIIVFAYSKQWKAWAESTSDSNTQ